MVEALVQLVVGLLMSFGAERLKDEISLFNSVEEERKNMSMKMKTIQKVLHDAENKSMQDKNVKEWLEDLQDIAYDMEAIMDEWNTRVLKQEMKDASHGAVLSCISLTKVGWHWQRDLAKRVRTINARMNMIFGDIQTLNLTSNALCEASNAIDRTTTSSIDESKVHGRDEDKNYLLTKVLCQNSDEHNSRRAISIVGAGGLGKTTLAQLLYNDEKVREEFDNRIWVCVSNPFDEFKVARGILEGVGVPHDRMIHLETLHEAIKKSLSKKKFILVLDDVWEEDSRKLGRLRMSLKFGAPESRIVVTTRSEEVAKMVSSTTSDIFKPTLISNSHCWLLMRQVAFQGKREQDCTKLEDIGRRIANKCKGFPLAAKVLGGLLRSKDTFEDWEEVLNSQIWNLEKAEMEIFPHMFLSYKELSSALKRCFSLCAIFPKDYSITTEQLVSLWMSQVHLESRTIRDNMLLTGQRYVKFLKSCAFLEEGNHTDSVKMHDIMHDFALHLSGHEFLSLVAVENSSRVEPQTYVKHRKARHLFVDGTINSITSFCDVGKLRSCVVKNVPKYVTLDLLKRLKVVRALYLQFCELEEVPEDIGKLIHLRTLDLSNNSKLCKLPETIGELYNLEYLWLRNVDDRANILPKSLGKLINLQELKEFRVKFGKTNLGMLKNLNKLGGALEIVFYTPYSDEADAMDAKLSSKKHITELSFDFGPHKVTNGVFEALEAPPGIQILTISKFKGERFLPNWITSLSYLKELTLSTVEVVALSPLGSLPSLERLCIEHFNILKFIGREFLGVEGNTNNKQVVVSFPKLLELKLSDCPKLEEWEDMKAEEAGIMMPKLESLIIVDCNQLEALPRLLLSKALMLNKVEIKSSRLLEESIREYQLILQMHLNRRASSSTDDTRDLCGCMHGILYVAWKFISRAMNIQDQN